MDNSALGGDAGAVEQQLGELDYRFKQGAQRDTLLDLGSDENGSSGR